MKGSRVRAIAPSITDSLWTTTVLPRCRIFVQLPSFLKYQTNVDEGIHLQSLSAPVDFVRRSSRAVIESATFHGRVVLVKDARVTHVDAIDRPADDDAMTH